jgi:glucokinase
MNNRVILSADIGGSHISVASFEKQDHGFVFRSCLRKNVDSAQTKDFILSEWVSLLNQINPDFSHTSIVMAMPAPFDYEHGICLIKDQGKFIHLFGVDLKNELASKLGIRNSQIHFVNDAQAFLIGESSFGKVSAYDNILGLTLGTGLGSAIKYGDIISDAALWSAKFKEGIAEDYLGTGWFINWVKSNTAFEVKGVKEIIGNRDLLHKAKPAFSQFSRNLAEFILDQVKENPVNAVVLGGNITKASDHFLDETIAVLRQNKNPIPIFLSDFGDKSALFGAASIFFDQKVLLGLHQE